MESSCSQSSSASSKDKNKESEGAKMENDSKPLLNKKTILGILSELVKSYSGVAQLIAEYEVQRPGKQNNSQVSSVKSGIFFNLYPLVNASFRSGSFPSDTNGLG
jgi:hypothetical protein